MLDTWGYKHALRICNNFDCNVVLEVGLQYNLWLHYVDFLSVNPAGLVLLLASWYRCSWKYHFSSVHFAVFFCRFCSCDCLNLIEVGAELIGRECFSCVMRFLGLGADKSDEKEEGVEHTSDSQMSLIQCKICNSPNLSSCSNHLTQTMSLWNAGTMHYTTWHKNPEHHRFVCLPSNMGLLAI